jgi:arthrofactin-type cyclic lipopeptide synthetase C
VLQAQSDYWQRTLTGAPALLELPTDRPRPVVQDYAGDVAPVELDAALTAGLKTLSQRHGTTLFMTLMAGWATVLSRLSGQDEVVIGTPMANRMRAEVEPLIGIFINTQALRLDLSGSPSVAGMLERVKARALEAQQHQDLPFEQVVELVKPPRSTAHSPLFQVMFNWQNNEEGQLNLGALTHAPVGAEYSVAKFDLTLNLGEQQDCIAGGLEYATSLFEAATIERMLGYLHLVLQGMVADDGQKIDALPLLDRSERHQLLIEWNATQVAYPDDQCLHALFEAQAGKTPDAVAVMGQGVELTYAELDARANQLAHHLHDIGVGPGSHVALLLERSLDLVVAELAILKCGAAYVPLDQNAPAERQAFMIADSQAQVVLSVTSLTVPDTPATRIDLDTLALDRQASHRLVPADDSAAAAAILYTSGSTGQPKGVIVPHRAIGRLVLNNHYARFAGDDRVAFTANPAFDTSSMEVWAPLLHGGRIVVIDQATLLDPQALAQQLQQSEVTILHLVAGLLSAYADSLAHVLPQLRYLLTGGDVVDPRAVARVLRHSAPQHLIHCYGPSETATFATTCEITDVADDATSLPIGRPIANTRIYLLDANGQPVPVGVAGEIHIGGAGVATGYLNQPALTAERFIADPFSSEPGARMYKTGDLGRYVPTATLNSLAETTTR